jgi:HPt (histidine-containing phosphotransfer) domain-containing protein
MGDVLDLGRLETLVAEIGDRSVVHLAVRTFLDELPVRVSALRRAIRDRDDTQLHDAAHALGSPAAMLGAVEVRRLTRELQAAARDGRAEEYAGLLAAVETATARSGQEMRAYLSPVA